MSFEDKDCLFSPDELYQLATALPRVERFGLDLRFEDKINYEYLDGIARFPSLKYLELNTPVYRGLDANAYSPKFWLDESVTKKLFQYVDSRTERHLAGLDIKVDEWERRMLHRKSHVLRELWVFAAWREIHLPSLVHVKCLPYELGRDSHLVED
ncbi:hypothetical protein BJX64DRAFT_288130 [Aspergillus heterothallicus]